MPQIGIDFGTTNSVLVSYDNRNHKFTYFNYGTDQVDNRTKPVPISSVVWYNDGKVVIGSEARDAINLYAGVDGHHFEKSIKLKLGNEFGVSVLGSNIPSYEIASEILKHLISVAVNKYMADLADVDMNRAVFTVPISFNGKQRKALRKAAQNANIQVVSFIHEPLAAIVGYYFSNSQFSSVSQVIQQLRTLNGRHLLVFDWGGGTLDITIVKVDSVGLIEIGTSELTGKAGDEFDSLIANWIWSKFIKKYEGSYNEYTLELKKKQSWSRILARAESCKIQLSAKDTAHFNVRGVIEDFDIDEVITRNDFNILVNETLSEALLKIDQAIKQAQINEVNLDEVLLVGGTCNIPYVQEKLIEKFGHKVKAINDSDLLIAQGAAVINEMGWLPFLTKDISIELNDGSLYQIFNKNMPIVRNKEAKVTEDLVCTDKRGGQAKIIIAEAIGQNKHRNLAILKVPVSNGSGKRFKDDLKLDACIDEDIVLEVKARSLNVQGFRPEENYSISVSTEIFELCFGLKIT